MSYIDYIPSKDGTKLYAKITRAERLFDFELPDDETLDEQINVIIVHGLAEYLDRYDKITDFLVSNSINVIRYDQRGHGRSEGKQTYYDHKDQIIEDLDAVVQYVKDNFGNKIYLIGHSMGGYNVAFYGTRYPGRVNGIITSGGVTRDNNRFFEEAYGDRQTPPDSYVPNVLSEGICSDLNVVRDYIHDALVPNEISMGLAYAIVDGVIELKENPDAFVDDVLILHGQADPIVNPKDSLQFYDEIASQHKAIRIYSDLQHEIFNESSYNELIFQDIVQWIYFTDERQGGTTF